MPESNSDDFIRYACRDRIATITFNRPEKLNAFNDAMVMRLADVLHGTAGSAFGPRAAVAGGGVLVMVLMLGLAAAVPALRRYRI